MSNEELTKEKCIETYQRLRTQNGKSPSFRDFLKHLSIHARQLERLFGSSPYSKIQETAGDRQTKLQCVRVPIDTIMHQYGSLVEELRIAPKGADWTHRELKPTLAGLSNTPHNIKWTEMPTKFVEWASENKKTNEFAAAIQIIKAKNESASQSGTAEDKPFNDLVQIIRDWRPARGRNSEEAYKIELRAHLVKAKLDVEEESGDSNFDLFVEKRYPIEIKKAPTLSEYDRLFGQIARHLQHQFKLIVLIHDATKGDTHDKFVKLVDAYFNVDDKTVVIITK